MKVVAINNTAEKPIPKYVALTDVMKEKPLPKEVSDPNIIRSKVLVIENLLLIAVHKRDAVAGL